MVHTLLFVGQMIHPVRRPVPINPDSSFKIASAPARPHRAPVISNRSFTMWRQAPSMIPVAIGQPRAKAVG